MKGGRKAVVYMILALDTPQGLHCDIKKQQKKVNLTHDVSLRFFKVGRIVPVAGSAMNCVHTTVFTIDNQKSVF